MINVFIKEKKKNYERKKTVLKLRSINILIALIILSYINIQLFYIRFSVADDYLLNNIISGTFGENYDSQLLYINNILGIIMNFFYHLIPNINIYTFYLITILCVCFTKVIEYMLENKQYIFFPVLFILYILTLFNITYTIIAYLSISIGFIEIIFRKDRKAYISYFLIINGVLLRSQALIPVFGVLGVILIMQLIKTKNSQKILNICGLMIVSFIFIICGNLVYKKDNTLKEFKKWQDTSISLRDYQPVNYNEYEELFKQIGWNENDLALFYSWNFADKEKFSIEKMETVVNNVSIKDRYNLNYKAIITNFIKQYYTKEFDINNIYIIIFIITFIITIKNTQSKRECLYVFLATLFLNIILMIRNRYPYRVVYPQYLLAIIYFIYDSKKDGICNNTIIKGKYVLGFNIIICTLLSILYIQQYTEISNYYKKEYKETIDFMEQISKKGNLYIADSLNYNYLTMNYKITDRKIIGEFDFLIKAGGGDCFSKRYYDYIKRFELKHQDNLYKNLKQENVYYIGNKSEILTQYLKENVDENYVLKECESINNITIYKFQSD